MCGIFGVYGNNDKSIAIDLRNDMISRGPNSQDISSFEGGMVQLGMNRLHLRGDIHSKVPFKIDNEIICYNGEIYGQIFKNDSFIINTAGGVDEIRFMNSQKTKGLPDGMFAIASFNTEKKILTLSRDRYGIKPFFYFVNDSELVFSSCIRSLMKISVDFNIKINEDALFDIFAFGHSLNEKTPFNKIRELLPDQVLNYSKRNNKLVNKAPLESFASKNPSRDFKKYLSLSVQNCVRGEYKIGLAVSGGIDSTILAYELNALGVKDIETFSVCLAETGDGIKDLSQLNLPKNGVWKTWKHNYVQINKENFKKYMLESINQFSYPTDMHSLPLYTALAKMVASKNIRILLTGEGADEYFMGYSKYNTYKGKKCPSDYYLSSTKGRFLKKIFSSRIVKNGIDRVNNFSTGDFWSQIREIEKNCRLRKLLLRTDVILMEHSIEGRTPFLHAGIPELAMSLSPSSQKEEGGKKLLRESYSNNIKGFRNKTKQRFKATSKLFWEVFNDAEIREMILEDVKIPNINISQDIIESIYNEYNNGNQSDLSELLFLILTTKQSIKNKLYGSI